MKIGNSVVLKKDGSIHSIIDRMFSESKQAYLYDLDNCDVYVDDSEIEIAPEINGKYDYEFAFDSTKVTATLYEYDAFGTKKLIATGYGSVVHAGIIGITQASSYAVKKIYEKVGGKF